VNNGAAFVYVFKSGAIERRPVTRHQLSKRGVVQVSAACPPANR